MKRTSMSRILQVFSRERADERSLKVVFSAFRFGGTNNDDTFCSAPRG
jgi:hypothetical protein